MHVREMQERKKLEFEVVVDVCALREHVAEVVPQPSVLHDGGREGQRDRSLIR